MSRLTIYQKPTCTTCRNVMKILREANVDFDSVDYYIDPIGRTKLKELLRKLKLPAQALLRTSEPIYKELRLSGKTLTEDEIVDLLVGHPELLQRPIAVRGGRAVLARPAERIRELLQ